MKPGFGKIQNIFNAAGGGYWTQRLINDSCLFFASDSVDILNKVVSTQLPNQVTGSSDFLTVTGSGLNARYRTPDSDIYRTADSDYVFWKTDASESICDGNRLIGYDFPRILVKYLNVAPYTILWIAILKPGVTVTDGMRDAFDLSIWWSDVLSFHGVIKGNRLSEKAVWTPEVIAVNGNPSALVALTYDNSIIDLTWTNGSTNEDAILVSMSTDGVNFGAETSLAAGTTSYSKTGLTIDTRYYFRVRAKRIDQYSNYSSIASDWTAIVWRGRTWPDTNADGTGIEGLADWWRRLTSYAITATIVTGNGFTGRAQRVVENNATNLPTIQPWSTVAGQNYKSVVNGVVYKVIISYRSSHTLKLYENSATLKASWGANTGNAILLTSSEFTAGAGSNLNFAIDYVADSWFELGDVIIKRKVV